MGVLPNGEEFSEQEMDEALTVLMITESVEAAKMLSDAVEFTTRVAFTVGTDRKAPVETRIEQASALVLAYLSQIVDGIKADPDRMLGVSLRKAIAAGLEQGLGDLLGVSESGIGDEAEAFAWSVDDEGEPTVSE